MNKDIAKPIVALLTSLFLVAVVTSFVLPGRPSPQVIRAFFAGLTGAIRSAIGINVSGGTPPAQQMQDFRQSEGATVIPTKQYDVPIPNMKVGGIQ